VLRVPKAIRSTDQRHWNVAGTNPYLIALYNIIFYLINLQTIFCCSVQNIMEVMGFIAVLVNCALIGLSGQVHRLLPDMTAIQTVLLIVALEVGCNFKSHFIIIYSIAVIVGIANLVMFVEAILYSCNTPSHHPKHITPNYTYLVAMVKGIRTL